MKKNNNIRSKVVKESLLDYNNLANTLKENTSSAVKELLSETVRDTFSKLIKEDEDTEDDDDYSVEDVEDTDSETSNEDDYSADDDSSVDTDDSEDLTDDDSDADIEGSDDADVDSDEGVDDNGDLTGETTASGEDEDGGEWSEFDKYKVSDDEYDLSDASDEDIVKVYKLLNNDDQVVVNKSDDGKVNIKDNETGAEYLVDLGGDEEPVADSDDETLLDDDEDSYASEDDFDNEDNDDMTNESRIYEIALNEYDSHVGYTDNYQSKDVMDSKGLSVADAADSKDWGSKGVRSRGNQKPWSGKNNSKSENQPFTAGRGKTVEEDDMSMTPDAGTSSAPVPTDGGDAAPVEEGASLGGRRGGIGSGRSTGTKQHVPSVSGVKNPYGKHHVSKNAKYYEGDVTDTNESIMRKANKIFRENKELKGALNEFKHVLQEAAVTNLNLGQIIKLISENTTSQDEKKEIIARFGKEAKTVQQSKNLYESISNDLKKNKKMNITEDKQLSAESSKQINETQIYKSEDLLESLDLMHRLCK